MVPQALTNQFARMGARLKVEEQTSRFSIDVRQDAQGECFVIRARPEEDLHVEVVNVQAADRHLLLFVQEAGLKQKFLCGHDERHWFVAAVPELPGIHNVQTALEALKPAEVQRAQTRKKVKARDRKRRKNEAYLRQGEWFFLPEPNLMVEENLILRNEPLSRGRGSKPHVAESCYRSGGVTVYVCSRYPNGLPEAEYRRVLHSNPQSKNWNWQVMRRNPRVYVRGRIRHPDHQTLVLQGWHRVVMNTENQSRAMQSVVFLD
jgi:hypothetical protein